MSQLDPYGGSAEPRGRRQPLAPEGSSGGAWSQASGGPERVGQPGRYVAPEYPDRPAGWQRADDDPRSWPDRVGRSASAGRGRPGPDAVDHTWIGARHGGAAPATDPGAGYGPPPDWRGEPRARRNGHVPGGGQPEQPFDPYPAEPSPRRRPVYRPEPVDARPTAYPGEAPSSGGELAAPTDPIGWPLVDPNPPVDPDPPVGPQSSAPWQPPSAADRPPAADADPPPDPEPPRRRGPGRRRATRSGKPVGSGRAGRNLPAAIGVGLALGAAIVVPLFLFRPAFLAVVAIAVVVGIWELVRAVRPKGARPPLPPLIGGGLLMVGLAWWAGPDALSLGLLVTVLATLVWRLGEGPAGYQRDLTAATLIAVYVPFLGGFGALLAAEPADGDLRVVVTLAAVVLSDTGGYAAGVAFGRHPMAPSVSPKKSWEGFAGSVLAAAMGSALLLTLLLDVAPWWGALFGLAISVAAVLGDLGESMLKRDLGIKDMSNLLPGHGGLMDRLDSILFAVPAGYLLLAILAPPG